MAICTAILNLSVKCLEWSIQLIEARNYDIFEFKSLRKLVNTLLRLKYKHFGVVFKLIHQIMKVIQHVMKRNIDKSIDIFIACCKAFQNLPFFNSRGFRIMLLAKLFALHRLSINIKGDPNNTLDDISTIGTFWENHLTKIFDIKPELPSLEGDESKENGYNDQNNYNLNSVLTYIENSGSCWEMHCMQIINYTQLIK